MKNVIDIDGYKAVVAFDSDRNLLRGEFLGLNGGADFHGRSVDELTREGQTSLRVFLDICREKGIEPHRSFSGRFNVRLDPKTHEAAVTAAAADRKSLNEWVVHTIRAAVGD